MIAAPFDVNLSPSYEDNRAAEIHARLDDEFDRVIVRDDERDELRENGGRRAR